MTNLAEGREMGVVLWDRSDERLLRSIYYKKYFL